MNRKPKNCGTCITNDCGLCDHKGILVEDDDYCESWKENWEDTLMEEFTEVK